MTHRPVGARGKQTGNLANRFGMAPIARAFSLATVGSTRVPRPDTTIKSHRSSLGPDGSR
jgi:hypothetical protein